MATSHPFGRVAIIGFGLIGASIALALRATGFNGTIAAADRDPAVRAEAERHGLCDLAVFDAAEAVADADLVILAVPVGAMNAVARAIAPALPASAIVTDVGSVKGAVIDKVEPALPDPSRFVPGHPIAGSERSGPMAGYASLFEDRWCILTPTERTNPAATETVSALWRRFGCEIEIMDATRHDLVLAITSHLPHLIAYNIVRTAYDMESVTEAEVIKFSAGGFRDFTRLAASDPTMWRDVFLNNREAVLETLGRFSEDLAMLQRAIRWRDGAALYELFDQTRAVRMSIIEAKQDTPIPDFGRPLQRGVTALGDGTPPAPRSEAHEVSPPLDKARSGEAPADDARADHARAGEGPAEDAERALGHAPATARRG